jgi:hypothetical protein
MEVQVKAFTYTGAGFRGMEDPNDGLPVKMTLVGSERNIVAFIRESFSYGDNGDMWLSDLVKAYKKGVEPMWDGCGAVAVIKENGKKLMDMRKSLLGTEKPTWVDLGIIDVSELWKCPSIDAIVKNR